MQTPMSPKRPQRLQTAHVTQTTTTLPDLLQGDVTNVRIAVVAGVSVPLLMFLSWDAAILGSLASHPEAAAAAAPGSGDPLAALAQSSPLTCPLIQASTQSWQLSLGFVVVVKTAACGWGQLGTVLTFCDLFVGMFFMKLV